METRLKVVFTALVLLLAVPLHAERNHFQRGKRNFEAGRMAASLRHFDRAIRRANGISARNIAYYYQGLALYELGMYYSSYRSFRMVLLKPDRRNKKVYGKAIKNAVTIMDRLGLVDRVGKLITKLPSAYIPSNVGHAADYAQGAYYHRTGKSGKAVAHFKAVHPKSIYYSKALFYLGVIATGKRDYKDAIFYFNKVAKITGKNTRERDREDLAKLNLARSLYSAKRREASVEAYARFTSSSPYWLDVLLEASWPLMLMNDTTVSLGNLHTLTSPFYREDLVGEAYVLKATVLYALCKYEEMRRTLAQFFEIYDPVLSAMKSERSRLDSANAFYLAYINKKGLNRAFRNLVDRDPGIQNLLKVQKMLNKERALLAPYARNKTLAKIKNKVLETIKFLGHRIGSDLRSIHRRKFKELVAQREQANYLKVEIVSGEKELIERSKGLPPKRVTEVETNIYAGYHFWPYKGEYWEDELGSYIYTTESACIN